MNEHIDSIDVRSSSYRELMAGDEVKEVEVTNRCMRYEIEGTDERVATVS